MATILFNNDEDGNLVEIRVEAERVQAYLANGYVCDPEELKAQTEEEAATNETGELSVKEIRLAAKKAGVKNWRNKKIDALKSELGYES